MTGRRATAAALAVAAVAAAGAAGCGGSSGGGSGTTTTGSAGADPGKALFVSVGCASCHTLKAAGATGHVGPNLDNLKPALPLVTKQVTDGGGGMPAFKDQLSTSQIHEVAAYVAKVAGR